MVNFCCPDCDVIDFEINLSFIKPFFYVTKMSISQERKKFFNPLSAKFIKWSNILKQIVGKLPTICLSMFDHFSGLALKGLRRYDTIETC